MKLLLNDKEIARFLCELINVYDTCTQIEHNEQHTADAIFSITGKINAPKFNIDKHRDKIKQKILQAVRKDLKAYQSKINQQIDNHQEHFYKNIHSHLDYFVDQLGQTQLLELYRYHKKQNFIKTVGLQIDHTAQLMRRKDFSNVQEDCLLRNTVGNEHILVNKIDNNWPFWFIDSGYSNFIEPNKKWHRLVRNHLHFNNTFVAPVDRLSNFTSFPQPWRKEGKIILIVEPGQFAASIMHVDAKSWAIQVANQLTKHTDRPIEIRSKINKKTRTSLYQQLCQGDYYCTVSINSNSAIESIWAGIPAVTLDRHASNSVTRNSLAQINDLYYGPLGDWLAWLSYCQFTFEELMDGTALNIVNRYHD